MTIFLFYLLNNQTFSYIILTLYDDESSGFKCKWWQYIPTYLDEDDGSYKKDDVLITLQGPVYCAIL